MSYKIATLKQHILPWFTKGTWTIADQALFAGSNFLLNIILARWLMPDAYGTFTVAYSIFLLFGIVQTGLLIEPMLVFGSSRYKAQFPAYLGLLLRGHVGYAFLGGLILAGIGWGMQWGGSSQLGTVLLTLVFIQPLIFFLWLMRNACYVQLKPEWATSGGLIYSLLVIGGAILLNRTASLSVVSALGLMGGSSLVAGLWLAWRLKLRPFARMNPRLLRSVKGRHLRYGKWAMPASAVQHIPEHLAYLLLPLVGGLAATGALKALANLIMPAVHIYAALSMLLVPAYVRIKDTPWFNRFVMIATPVVLLVTTVYWLVLGWYGKTLIGWLYDGQYTEYAGLLWLVGAFPLRVGIGAIFRAALIAMERPDRVFWVYLYSAIVAGTIGVGLILWYGLIGAIISALLQSVVEVGLFIYFFVQLRIRHKVREVGLAVQLKSQPQ